MFPLYASVVNISDMGSVAYRLHSKAGETVLVHGASGGVSTTLRLLSILAFGQSVQYFL